MEEEEKNREEDSRDREKEGEGEVVGEERETRCTMRENS